VEKETNFYQVFLIFWMIIFGGQQREPLRMKVNINPGIGVVTYQLFGGSWKRNKFLLKFF